MSADLVLAALDNSHLGAIPSEIVCEISKFLPLKDLGTPYFLKDLVSTSTRKFRPPFDFLIFRLFSFFFLLFFFLNCVIYDRKYFISIIREFHAILQLRLFDPQE